MDAPSPSSTALVVIDLQRGFFEQPTLAAEAERVVAATNDLSLRGMARGLPVFIVRTQHARDRSTWTLSMIEDDQGFNFSGTPQADLLSGSPSRPQATRWAPRARAAGPEGQPRTRFANPS